MGAAATCGRVHLVEGDGDEAQRQVGEHDGKAEHQRQRRHLRATHRFTYPPGLRTKSHDDREEFRIAAGKYVQDSN